GVPNGLYVEDGQMSAGHAAFRSGTRLGRGSVGFRTNGSLVFDRLATTITLTTDIDTVTVDELNRHPRTTTDGTRAVTGELILFDDRYGGSINVPAGGIIVTLDQLAMATNAASQASITSITSVVTDTAVRVDQGAGLLIAYGDKTPVLQPLATGTQVTLTNQINPYETPQDAWNGLRHALPGGPHLIGNGQIRSLTAWRQEGFSETHLTGRQPRTAIAQAADGTVLLVTIDGRQSGWSDGVNMRELAQILVNLGARDAINLDGGGSSVMTSNATIINRPSEARRSVANGLFVYAPLPNPARGTDLACGAQLAASPFVDIASNVHVKTINCLSQYAITSGVTETLYMPQETVTRGQMATFLSAFIDEMAARGGRSLPQVNTSTFTDVTASNVHKANIERLAAAGILTGKTATTFGPHERVTRGQTARMIAETARFITDQSLPANRDTFTDDTDNVHEDPIDRLNGVRVIAGVGGFAYSPHAPVTRGAMASFLMRTTDYLIDTGTLR
ncbi:MAG: phosphodiester glycosidase family protein, partial [Nitriliruptoraceae bacterium]